MPIKQISKTLDLRNHNQRLDVALAECIPDISKRKIRLIIDMGGVYINGKRVRVASRNVHAGDKLELTFDPDRLQKGPKSQVEFELNQQHILYFDHNLIAINKPPGLPSQATKDQSVDHAERALARYLQRNAPSSKKPPILLHRLDKETSGILLFGLEAKLAEAIAEGFRQRRVHKEYDAISYGLPKQEKFQMECYLSGIDKRLGLVRAVKSGGRHALTDFERRKIHQEYRLTLFRCFPHTGRSHQIRVHLDMAGHPIVGDKRYGKAPQSSMPEELKRLSLEHHFLHAALIRVEIPGAGEVEICAPRPPLMTSFCQRVFSEQ